MKEFIIGFVGMAAVMKFLPEIAPVLMVIIVLYLLFWAWVFISALRG